MKKPYARIAFDFKLMQPGCVLLQAAMGCFGGTLGNPANDFPNEYWLLAPTPDLKVYDVETEEQYNNIVDNYEDMRAHAKRVSHPRRRTTPVSNDRTSPRVR